MNCIKRKISEIEVDGLRAELSSEPSFIMEYVEHKVERAGDLVIVGYLVDDHDVQNPLEDCDGRQAIPTPSHSIAMTMADRSGPLLEQGCNANSTLPEVPACGCRMKCSGMILMKSGRPMDLMRREPKQSNTQVRLWRHTTTGCPETATASW